MADRKARGQSPNWTGAACQQKWLAILLKRDAIYSSLSCCEHIFEDEWFVNLQGVTFRWQPSFRDCLLTTQCSSVYKSPRPSNPKCQLFSALLNPYRMPMSRYLELCSILSLVGTAVERTVRSTLDQTHNLVNWFDSGGLQLLTQLHSVWKIIVFYTAPLEVDVKRQELHSWKQGIKSTRHGVRQKTIKQSIFRYSQINIVHVK